MYFVYNSRLVADCVNTQAGVSKVIKDFNFSPEFYGLRVESENQRSLVFRQKPQKEENPRFYASKYNFKCSIGQPLPILHFRRLNSISFRQSVDGTANLGL
jgi:hypothetical protein